MSQISAVIWRNLLPMRGMPGFRQINQLFVLFVAFWCLLTPFGFGIQPTSWVFWCLLMHFDAFWCLVMPCDAFWIWSSTDFLSFLMPSDAFWIWNSTDFLSCLVPFDAFWCLLMPFDALWCLVTPFDALWRLLMPFDAFWCLVMPCDAFWIWSSTDFLSFLLPFDAFWHLVTPFDAFWCLLMPSDAFWCLLTPFGFGVQPTWSCCLNWCLLIWLVPVCSSSYCCILLLFLFIFKFKAQTLDDMDVRLGRLAREPQWFEKLVPTNVRQMVDKLNAILHLLELFPPHPCRDVSAAPCLRAAHVLQPHWAAPRALPPRPSAKNSRHAPRAFSASSCLLQGSCGELQSRSHEPFWRCLMIAIC